MRLFLPRQQRKEKPGDNPLSVRFLNKDNPTPTHPLLSGTHHPISKATNLLKSPNLIKCQEIDHIVSEHTKQHPFLFAVNASIKHGLALEFGPDDIWLLLLQWKTRKMMKENPEDEKCGNLNFSETSSGVTDCTETFGPKLAFNLDDMAFFKKRRLQMRPGWQENVLEKYIDEFDSESCFFYVENGEFFKRPGLSLLSDDYFSCSLPCEKIALQMAAFKNTRIQKFRYPEDENGALPNQFGIDRYKATDNDSENDSDSDDSDSDGSSSSGESVDYSAFLNQYDHVPVEDGPKRTESNEGPNSRSRYMYSFRAYQSKKHGDNLDWDSDASSCYDIDESSCYDISEDEDDEEKEVFGKFIENLENSRRESQLSKVDIFNATASQNGEKMNILDENSHGSDDESQFEEAEEARDLCPCKKETAFSDTSSVCSINTADLFNQSEYKGPCSVEIRGNIIDWNILRQKAAAQIFNEGGQKEENSVQLQILDHIIAAQRSTWEPNEKFWNCVHIWAKYLVYGEEDYHNSTFLEWLADGKTEVKNCGNDEFEEDDEEEEEEENIDDDFQAFNQKRQTDPATGNSRVKSSFYYGINQTDLFVEHCDTNKRVVSLPAKLYSGHVAIHTSVKKSGKRQIRAEIGWMLQYQ